MSYSNNTKSMKSFCRWHERTETADQEYDQGMIDEATTGEKKRASADQDVPGAPHARQGA